jgi:hypothetical protein
MAKQAWYPSTDLIAQLGHAGWGALFVLAFALFGHERMGIAAMFIWATPKEFIFDVFVEGESVAAGVRDLGFYSAGVMGAILLLAVHKLLPHLHRIAR